MREDRINDTDNNVAMETAEAKPSERPRRRLRWLKAIGWTVVIIAVAFLVTCSAIVWFLTPDRLTPAIEKIASRKLNADVNIGRAELTFWSSFPNIRVEVDRLDVVSRSLTPLTDEEKGFLPSNANSLMSVGHFSGSINIAKIVSGEIALNDVVIDRPRVNMLQVNDSVANFNILPATPPDTAKSDIPNISIHHFAITNAGPITYRSLSDSISMDLKLNTIDLSDRGLPLYELTLDTDFDTPMLRDYNLTHAKLNLDGDIKWDGENPYNMTIRDLVVIMEGIDVVINTTVNFRDELRVEDLDVKVNRLDISKLKEHAPAKLSPELSQLSTDMVVNIDLRLKEPLVFSDSLRIPVTEIEVDIPECRVDWRDLHWNRFSTSMRLATSGNGLNSTRLDIDHVMIDGRAMDFNVSGTLKEVFGTPEFDGRLSAAFDFNRLPAVLRRKIPGKLNGRISANTRLRMKASDLSGENFHRIYADGNALVTGLTYYSPDSTTELYSERATLEFGSRRSITTRSSSSIDSMLVIKIGVDTIGIVNGEHHLAVKDFRGAFASRNSRSSSDTTRINPFGGTIGFGRFMYFSEHDSVFLRLRNAGGLATLQQYRDERRIPQIGINVGVEGMHVSSHEFAAAMKDSRIQMTAHFRQRRRRRDVSAEDSATITPAVVRTRPRALTAQQLDSIGVETVDFKVDNSIREILRRWNATGSVTSSKGILRLAGMPLRSRLSNLDATFTTDSIALNSLTIEMGESDFDLSGSISNLRQAMNRRRPQPLKMNLSVISDTIHINELVQAASSGYHSEDLAMTDGETEEWEEVETDKLDRELHRDSVTGAILVPVNIDAGLHVKAGNVIYSDLDLEDFHGDVLINRGVLQLHDIAARNAVGSIRVSALYSAPTERDMNVGIGMVLDNFHLDRIKTLMPALVKVMPMLKSFSGTVSAKLAATVDILPNMDLDMPTLRAALNFNGDSIAVEDNPTMRTAAKWLMFKNKKITRIDSIDVNIIVRDNYVQLYPFMATIDRYRLGIMGHSDLAQNLDYHVAVMKSPIPFKFGINIKGTAEHPKIRFGGAKLKPDMIASRDAIADTVRVNLVREMNTFFRKGLRAARLGPLNIKADTLPSIPEPADPVISASDSLLLIDAGLIEVSDSTMNHLNDEIGRRDSIN